MESSRPQIGVGVLRHARRPQRGHFTKRRLGIPHATPRGSRPILFLLLLFLFLPFPLSAAGAEEASPYAKAVAAYQDRRLDEALVFAKEAIREEPEHVEAYLLLGELYYLRQDLDKAQESWQRALKLAPSRRDIRERLEKLEREAPLEKGLSRSDTAPFVVRFAENQMALDVGDLRQVLRDTYREVGQQFQYFPDHPITVILYPPSSFEQVKGLSHQVAGLYDGKIRLPIGAHSQSQENLKRILWHEYTHSLVHDLAKGRCPIWLNEGIAVLQETRVFPIDSRTIQEILQKRPLIPWSQLWQEEYAQGDLEFHYVQGYLVAQYLVRHWGWNDLVSLLKRLGQGYPIGDALQAQYKEDPRTLEKEWLVWLKNRGILGG